MLSSRENLILKGIIESFIESGAAIGSRTLVKSYDLGLSSATIRNVMSDLEDLGFLNKTHQSSGRIPSVKALKFYISNIINEELMNNEAIDLYDGNMSSYIMDGNKGFEKTLSKLGKILNDITDYASLTFITKDSNKIVKEIFIKEISENSYIFVIMLDNDEIFTKLLSTDEATDFIGTEKFNRFLTDNFKNKSTKYLVENLVPLFNFTFYRELKALNKLVEDFKTNEPDELKLFGMSRLLEHPDFDEIDKIKKVVSLMKDDTEIRDILSNDDKGGIEVYISDDEDDPLSNLAMITSTYHIDGNRIASFGVIAPIRINYMEEVSKIIELDKSLNLLLKKDRGARWKK